MKEPLSPEREKWYRSQPTNIWDELLRELDRVRDELNNRRSEFYQLMCISNENTSRYLQAEKERDALKAESKILIKSLEKIRYWQSDARVCCFPVDLNELLAKYDSYNTPSVNKTEPSSNPPDETI